MVSAEIQSAASSGASQSEPLVQVINLVKHFPITSGVIIQRQMGAVKAVDDVTFDIYPGETLGLVGESGSGKSTTGRTLLQLYQPTSGTVLFEGKDITKMRGESLRRMRREMQIIFQDPFASLNPRMTVGSIVAEPLQIHKLYPNKRERQEYVESLLERVGLNPYYVNRYPHEFSGGQRQRIGIARALALRPRFIVADEPISALDVSIQAQVVNLLQDLQEEFGLAYLFIAHDLSVVRYLSDRIAVMYLGRIVEMATAEELFEDPRHPYTRALLSAVPTPDPKRRGERIVLQGDVPSPVSPPPGCHFAPRCPVAEARCHERYPDPVRLGPTHTAACHLLEPASAPA